MGDPVVDQRLRDIQREYLDFLDDDDDQGIYSQMVKDMITRNEFRLIVNINHLRRRNAPRAEALLTNTVEEILLFERALKEMVSAADATYAKQKEEFFIGFEGSFGSRHASPRNLTAHFLGNLVCVEGVVTKCSLLKPKVVRSVHYCPATKKSIERRYADLTSYNSLPTSSVYPTKDDDGNLLETEYGLSTYKDHQTLSIQELPEKSPLGQLPRSTDIVADNDLVDKCKPGDRVQVVGIYRCLPGKQNNFTSGAFRAILIANNIISMSKEVSCIMSKEDIRKCRDFSRHKELHDLLARSLAPSIHGHEYIKKSLLCMLLGGIEKILPNGSRLRGDINILMIGDPSVAKSQLLRYVLHAAPRAVSTTGRGSTGVGLTAAVTSDHETGERRLEAGAMVMADRGVVCIDEFDKMTDIDRTAIHEVMEQGRVTIAKAGIHARLNARCSVLAAANPLMGRYNQYRTPLENIGLQDSLLSRFDLVFIMLDVTDPDHDRIIADHIVRTHRYIALGEENEVQTLDTVDLATQNTKVDEDDDDTPIYEKYDVLLHGSLRSKKEKIVSVKFMRKYVMLAKSIRPTLTQEAADCIAEEYSRLRSQNTLNTDMSKTQTVTPRALETLIRLSTAFAKLRLSKSVDVRDAQMAIELVQYAYFKKVLEKVKKRSRKAGSCEEETESDDELYTPKVKRIKKSSKAAERRRPSKKPGEEGYDPYEFDEEESVVVEDQGTVKSVSTTQESLETTTISEARLKTFKGLLSTLFKEKHAQSLLLEEVMTFVNKVSKDEPYSQKEVNAALNEMSNANQVMVSDDIVFLI